MTQLKRNTKAKGNRISGRKRPRSGITILLLILNFTIIFDDYDVNPALASIAKKKPIVLNETTEENMTAVCLRSKNQQMNAFVIL